MAIDVDHFEKVLTARKTDLNAALHRYEASLERPKSADFEDGAIERENDEVIEGLGISGQAELHLIEAALGRIAAGEYGICAQCGEMIPNARLETVPHAALCRSCADQDLRIFSQKSLT